MACVGPQRHLKKKKKQIQFMKFLIRPHMSLIRVQTNNWFNLFIVSIIACAISNEACIIP